MAERPIIIEDHFPDWDVVVGRTVVRNIDRGVGYVVDTVKVRHTPFTRVTDFETMVFDFQGYITDDKGKIQPDFSCNNKNGELGLGARLMEYEGATIDSANEYHYETVNRLAEILENEV